MKKASTKRLNAPDADMSALQENIEALRERLPASLLGVIRHQAQPDAAAAAAQLNVVPLEVGGCA